MNLLDLPNDILRVIFDIFIERDIQTTIEIDKNWKAKTIRRSKFLPYLLVCRKFREIILFDFLKFLKEIDYKCSSYYIKLIDQIRDIGEPKLWINVTKVKPEKYAGSIADHKYKDMYIRWKSISCKSSYERKIVHNIATKLDLYHQTYRNTFIKYDGSKHWDYSYRTPCDGCRICKIYRTRKAGVLISDQPVKLNPSANTFIKKLRYNINEWEAR